MTDTYTDHETGVHYCGGEMEDWSDRPAAADVLPAHAARLVPDDARRVLLIGARAAAVAPLLSGDREFTVVVRGETDAERLAATGATIHCGALGRWTPTDRFDAAVVLDPPDRILPPASDGIGHFDLLHLVEGWAPTTIAYVENGAGLPSLDHQERGPFNDRDLTARGTSYDLRPPTATELTRAHRRPTALVFGARAAADVVVAPDRLDNAVVTLIRSRSTLDLRWDALLEAPASAVTGWLLGGNVRDRSLTFRNLTGEVVTDGEPTAVGTPLETPFLRLLRSDDRPRLTTALKAYARWVGRDQGPLPRDVVATDQGFAPIESAGPRVDLAAALIDLAAAVAGRPHAHRFGPELDRVAIAARLADLLPDGPDGAALTAADAAYEGAPFARPTVLSHWQEQQSAAQLRAEVLAKEAQLEQVRAELAKDQRDRRALERSLAADSGPRATNLLKMPADRLGRVARRLGR
ncbi:hypothetical protein [Calidifontibacter terrae]